MKVSQVEVEQVVKVTGIRLDMSEKEAKALWKAIDRACALASRVGYSADLERFGKFRDGLHKALGGSEATIQIEEE